MTTHSRLMIGFGLFLIVCGVLGWGAVGFDRRGATAIMSGSMSGGLMIVMGLLTARGGAMMRRVGVFGGLVLAVGFGGVFVWRAIVGWQQWAAGEPKLAVAVLISTMAAASFAVFGALLSMRPWEGIEQDAAAVEQQQPG